MAQRSRGGTHRDRRRRDGGTRLSVEKVPPDPRCAPRPVAGAVVLIRDASGAEAARVTTRRTARSSSSFAPGTTSWSRSPRRDSWAQPGAQSVTVVDGVASTVELDYDTGIR